jgi:hypothetical protein
MVLNGVIQANGVTGNNGSGSGGGIYIDLFTSLTGTGSITAVGGSTTNGEGAGGGGRIALYAADYSQFNTANITAPGGTGGAVGAVGTVTWPRPRFPTQVRQRL